MSEPNTLIARRYRLRKLIGRGGMSRVWLATDVTLCRDVAIEEIVPAPHIRRADLDRLSRRVLNEAQAIARLAHRNVIQIYDLVSFRRMPWIVMEYVRSRSLHDLVALEGALPPEYVAAIGLDLLDALTAAHAVGVLHRDVTPRNTLIAMSGRAVLSDFGLATWQSQEEYPELKVMGTAGFVAPERASTGESTPEGDLWSLGATLYAAVEGRSPYARATVVETLTALLTEDPDPPQRAGELGAVLRGLLVREPHRRLRPPQLRRMLKAVAAGEMIPDLSDSSGHFPEWGSYDMAHLDPVRSAERPQARWEAANVRPPITGIAAMKRCA
jgi:serine/threonine protein kinase